MKNYGLNQFLFDFPDERAAIAYFVKKKNPGITIYRRARGRGYSTATGEYYSPFKGTIFRGARLPIDVWFYAIFLLHYSPFWDVKDYAKRIDVTVLTAFKIIKKLEPLIDRKKAFLDNLDEIIMGKK